MQQRCDNINPLFNFLKNLPPNLKLSDSELRFRFFRFLATAAEGGEMGSNYLKNTLPKNKRLTFSDYFYKI
ncbi:MAG: hypothetical protein A2651_02950 [Candidatus Yanofskybacteria bacterium RIFCSPHIGHO2_01_FULL_42_12]|nr:MAG: hypothetical protein A2651_02950 [Candidatus Yanofskybacteria bacterium RIFCSPHIGHO2_01_FULL_42_12]